VDIRESFSRVRIQAANVDLDEEEEQTLRQIVRDVMESTVANLNEENMSDENFLARVLDSAVNTAMQTFVAGRCYEEQYAQSETFPVDLPKEVLGDFIQFLARRTT
jgi:hypothetical protein